MVGLHEWSNIQRAIQLAQPVLDAYNQHRDVVDKLKALIDQAERLKASAQPILSEYQAVDNELVPLLAHLSQAFFPHEIKEPSKAIPTPADGYNVRWLQQSLVDLANAGKFEWPPNVRAKNFVDDDLGPQTRIVIEAYQQACLDRKLQGWDKRDVDGWAGMKTCAQLYNDLAGR